MNHVDSRFRRAVLFLAGTSALLAGCAAAQNRAMTADSAGNVYLTGSTSSLNFSTTAGALQTKPGGGRCLDFVGSLVDCTDVFVTKLDPRGAVIFSTYLGGDGQDEGTAIRVDSSGNIYVAGSTLRNHDGVNHFPVTAGAAFRNPSSLEDAFIVKLLLQRVRGIVSLPAADTAPDFPDPMHIAINFTPASLLDPRFEASALADLVEEHGLSPHQITLECTEQQAVSDVVPLKRQVKAQ